MGTLQSVAATLATCLLAGCSARVTPASAPSSPVPAAATESAEVPPAATECELACESPQMLPRGPDEPDYTQREVDNANVVLGSMQSDLLACYKRRLRSAPEAHGFITVDILIRHDGTVQTVDTTGGAILGETTMNCIVHRIERGTFDPPHGGGSLHVRVPFSLRRVVPGDDT